MVSIEQLYYLHPNKDILFQNISFSLEDKQKAVLVGNNGSGKSTLLQIITGIIAPSEGKILFTEKPYYIPQHFGQYDEVTVASALGVESKLNALHAILNGNTSELNFNLLNDDWNIEDKISYAFSLWKLPKLSYTQKLKSLSGGEKTKLFLSGIYIHQPTCILMDEPSNHLDKSSREILYDFIKSTSSSLLIASHDRTLLNLTDLTFELTKTAIKVYRGNYDFYRLRKKEESESLETKQREIEKDLKKFKKTAHEMLEKKQKENSRGKQHNENKGLPKIMMNNLRNKAENSTSKLIDSHIQKINKAKNELHQIKNSKPLTTELKLNLENTHLHNGKILFDIKNINFNYLPFKYLWKEPLNFQILSGDRTAIQGNNGSGKTSLILLLLGKLKPDYGEIHSTAFSYIYMDQEYSLLDNSLTVWEQIQPFNIRNLPEHELKTLLNRFLFLQSSWNKKCEMLSGGEKMRLTFCCLLIQNQTPDLFILDEPTNNLDIESMEVITNSLKEYKGTLVIISHDEYFLKELNINKYIILHAS